MSTQSATETPHRPASAPPDLTPSLGRRTVRAFRFGNISAVYVLIVVIVVFCVWKPHQFANYDTVAQVLNTNAPQGLAALALVIPLAAGVFDLSVGFTLGSTSVLLAFLLGHGWGAGLAVVVAMSLGLVIGIVNATIVVGLGIDSFIGTLASGSLLQAFMLALTGNQELVTGVGKVQFLAFDSWQKLTIPVAVMFVVAALIWYFLTHTAAGRFVYATGLGEEQARLAGVNTGRIRFASLIVSGLVAGVAGILVTGLLGAGSPTTGPDYLIPAFAAVFLGATQLRDGLWNAWGTVIAVLLLGTVETGLALANVAEWVPYVVNGAVLIIALGMRRLQFVRPRRRSRRSTTPGTTAVSDGSMSEGSTAMT